MMRKTEPPRFAGGIRAITPSGTGSAAPAFDAGAASVIQSPARTGAPVATSAVGICVSETMYERPAAFTPVTILRTLPGMSVPPLSALAPQPRPDGLRHPDTPQT